ncbi:MAG: RNA polymerase sigma factor [Terriglobia bacterium]
MHLAQSAVTAVEAASSRALLRRAQQGDEAAFQALFDNHKRRVYSLCLRMSRGRDEAEHATREVFVRVFRNIAAFRDPHELVRQLDGLAIRLASGVHAKPAGANLECCDAGRLRRGAAL